MNGGLKFKFPALPILSFIRILLYFCNELPGLVFATKIFTFPRVNELQCIHACFLSFEGPVFHSSRANATHFPGIFLFNAVNMVRCFQEVPLVAGTGIGSKMDRKTFSFFNSELIACRSFICIACKQYNE